MGLIRAAIAVVITFLVVLFIFARYGGTDYLEPVADKFSDLFKQKIVYKGNVSFTLTVDNYGELFFEADNTDVSFKSTDMTLKTRGGSIGGSRSVSIEKYSGTLSVSKNKLEMNGTFEKIVLPELNVVFNSDDVEVFATFENLIINNLKAEKLSFENVSGNLKVRNLDIDIKSQGVNLTGVRGNFQFSGEMTIDGDANSLAIPEADVFIE